MQGIVYGPHRGALSDFPQRSRRRVLALRQPVNPVVKQDDVNVHVAADAVHQVVAADAQSVAVARDHPKLQVRVDRRQAAGHRGRASMNAVHPIAVHVIGEPAGAADPEMNTIFSRGIPSRAASSSFARGWNSPHSRGTSGRLDRWQNRQRLEQEVPQQP